MNYFSVQGSILKKVIVITISPPFLLFLKEGLIWFIGYCLLFRDAEARTKDWSHGERVLPGLLPLSCLTTFLTQPGPSGQEWNYAGRGLPTSTGNQENAPQTCPQANLMITALQVKSPLPKRVKLTTKISHYFFIVFTFFFHFC